MSKTQFLREATFQRLNRLRVQSAPSEKRRIALQDQISASLKGLSVFELTLYKAEVMKRLDRERRLHRAHSYLYSANRHIQLYATMKLFETQTAPIRDRCN